MRRFILLLLLVVFLLGPVVACFASSADRARASCAPFAVGARVVVLLHLGRSQADDVITGASSMFARRAELHRMAPGMSMEPQPGIAISGGHETDLAGPLHVMLIGTVRSTSAGDRFPITLTFAHAPPLTLLVRVIAAARG